MAGTATVVACVVAEAGIDYHLVAPPNVVYSIAHFSDETGSVSAENERERLPLLAAPNPEVAVVQGRGSHTYQDLSRPWPRRRHLHVTQGLRPTWLAQANCKHGTSLWHISCPPG